MPDGAEICSCRCEIQGDALPAAGNHDFVFSRLCTGAYAPAPADVSVDVGAFRLKTLCGGDRRGIIYGDAVSDSRRAGDGKRCPAAFFHVFGQIGNGDLSRLTDGCCLRRFFRLSISAGGAVGNI